LKCPSFVIRPDNAAVLSVDHQDKVLEHVQDHETVLSQAVNLVKVARLAGVAVMKIEHCPDKLGPTNRVLAEAMGPVPAYPKVTWSAFRNSEIEAAVSALGVRQLIIFGVECHICVCQTTLDALDLGYQVFVVADAASSIKPMDRDIALARVRAAGAYVTTAQAAAFELIERADTDLFRRAHPILKLM
jgi:nicotinamidase-related amidase